MEYIMFTGWVKEKTFNIKCVSEFFDQKVSFLNFEEKNKS